MTAPLLRSRVLAPLLFVATVFAGTAPSAGAQGTTSGQLDAGIALFDQRRYADARTRLREAAESGATEAEASYYLGRIALVEGNPKAGVHWLERAIEREPRRADYHRWLGRAYAREALRAGRFRQAMLAGRIRDSFERAVVLDPREVEARLDLVQFYLVAPSIVGGSEDKAREQAAQIAKLNEYRGAIAAGWVSEDAGQMAEAEQSYRDAIRDYPDSSAAYIALGTLFQRNEEYDRAFDVFEELLRAQPSERAAYYHIGRTGSVSGERLDEAEAALRRYLAHPPGEADPSLASAHYRLGLIYERQGRVDMARKEYEATVRLDPTQKDAEDALERIGDD
ncbi:MAG: tetratricopeptide repeat protein [Gemmatimonadaceae bacterium]